jgi:hypothetical protein
VIVKVIMAKEITIEKEMIVEDENKTAKFRKF